MLDWFRSFLPKEDRFFDVFEQHAALVAAGSDSLKAALYASNSSEALKHLAAVSVREDEADAVAREVMLAVRRTFITPFDRTAIIALIGSLDDAIDEMKKTSKAIRIFEYTHFEPEMCACPHTCRHRASLHRQIGSGVDGRRGSENGLHRAWKPLEERLLRKFQCEAERRTSQRRDLLFVEGSAGHYGELAAAP